MSCDPGWVVSFHGTIHWREREQFVRFLLDHASIMAVSTVISGRRGTASALPRSAWSSSRPLPGGALPRNSILSVET